MTIDFIYEFIDRVNLWLLFFILLITYLLAIILGYKYGVRRSKKEHPQSFNSTIQISILALLVLLIGFTFAMAAFRFEVRRNSIIEESNAIYTADLRAKLLPDPVQKEVQNLLQRYSRLRSEDLSAEENVKKIARFEKETSKLQKLIWDKISVEAEKDPNAIFILKAINNMIELYTNREMAMANHIPEVILLLLFIAATTTFFLSGYCLGLENSNDFMPIILFYFLVLVFTVFIVDLDRPRRGFILANVYKIINIKEISISPYDK